VRVDWTGLDWTGRREREEEKGKGRERERGNLTILHYLPSAAADLGLRLGSFGVGVGVVGWW
jgi:hypothetical protein